MANIITYNKSFVIGVNNLWHSTATFRNWPQLRRCLYELRQSLVIPRAKEQRSPCFSAVSTAFRAIIHARTVCIMIRSRNAFPYANFHMSNGILRFSEPRARNPFRTSRDIACVTLFRPNYHPAD